MKETNDNYYNENQKRNALNILGSRFLDIPEKLGFLLKRLLRSDETTKGLYELLGFEDKSAPDLNASKRLKSDSGRAYIDNCIKLIKHEDKQRETLDSLHEGCYEITGNTKIMEITSLDHLEYLWNMAGNRGSWAEWISNNITLHKRLRGNKDLIFAGKHLQRLERFITTMIQYRDNEFPYIKKSIT